MSDQIFRNLHHGPGILLLPNAWDSGSARLIESLGAAAIATTSAGVAWSRGYPDGDALPIEQLLVTAREIARVIRVPLTAVVLQSRRSRRQSPRCRSTSCWCRDCRPLPYCKKWVFAG